jgi:nitrate/nitrite-specific signal transduction histidine kinase
VRKEKGSDISEESVLALQERIKELDCLYKIYKSLHKATNSDEAVRLVLDQLAGGFRYPDLVTVRIVIDGRQCSSKDTWHESRTIFSDLIVDGRTVGEIGVSLSDQVKFPGEPFLMKRETFSAQWQSVYQIPLKKSLLVKYLGRI